MNARATARERKINPILKKLTEFNLKIELIFPRSNSGGAPQAKIFLGQQELRNFHGDGYALDYGAKLLSLGRLPRSLELRLAYVAAGNSQYAVFDTLKGIDGDHEVALLPAMFAKIENPRAIANFYIQLCRIAKERSTAAEKFEVPKAAKLAGWIEHDIEIRKFWRDDKNNSDVLECHTKATWHRYPLGEYACLLPIPKLTKVDKKQEHGTVLGLVRAREASFVGCNAIWESLERLSGILETGKDQTILIKGPPGSGKEVFSNALHYGALRRDGAKYLKHSLAGATLGQTEERLSGVVTERGAEIEGLIAQARGGTLFLDEFDKAVDLKLIGGFLLRVLEAKEFLPKGGQKMLKVDHVNWVFAGSFDPKQGKGIGEKHGPPTDFGSRLTDQLKLKNALTQKGYAAALFLYFHMTEIIDWLGDKDWYKAIVNGEGDFRVALAKKALDVDFKDPPIFPGKEIRMFAMDFEKIVTKLKTSKDVSVRSIRQSTSALTHYMLKEFLTHSDTSIQKLRKEIPKRAKSVLEAVSPAKWKNGKPTRIRPNIPLAKVSKRGRALANSKRR